MGDFDKTAHHEVRQIITILYARFATEFVNRAAHGRLQSQPPVCLVPLNSHEHGSLAGLSPFRTQSGTRCSFVFIVALL